MATASAYALPAALSLGSGPATTFTVNYSAVAGDGVAQPVQFGSCFTYDATQTPAANLAAFKAQVAGVAGTFGFTVSVSNVLIFTAVN